MSCVGRVKGTTSEVEAILSVGWLEDATLDSSAFTYFEEFPCNSSCKKEVNFSHWSLTRLILGSILIFFIN